MEHMLVEKTLPQKSLRALGWMAFGAVATITGMLTLQVMRYKRVIKKRERQLDEVLESTMDASDAIGKY